MIITAEESKYLDDALIALNDMCNLFVTCDSCPLNKFADYCGGECPVDMVPDTIKGAEVKHE